MSLLSIPLPLFINANSVTFEYFNLIELQLIIRCIYQTIHNKTTLIYIYTRIILTQWTDGCPKMEFHYVFDSINADSRFWHPLLPSSENWFFFFFHSCKTRCQSDLKRYYKMHKRWWWKKIRFRSHNQSKLAHAENNWQILQVRENILCGRRTSKST